MTAKETSHFGKNKYYILGSNFGPYKTNEYYKNLYGFFKNAEDVCFREKYSYELFKSLPNIRYASDIVFNLDVKDIKKTNKKKVIFSIISCEYKIGLEYKKDYEEKMIEMIEFFTKKGYEICLMSFCKEEKDEEAIEAIFQQCSEKLKPKIEKYFYRGNIKEALDRIGDSSLMVGSRFHANIIALLLGKKVIPVLYSDKTKHVIEDMQLNLKMIDIKDIKNFNVKENEEILLQEQNNTQKISEAIKDASRQFEELDKILGKEQ